MGDGGWTARSTAYAFQRYAKVVMARLGDRLDSVATFNEPWCSVWLSHLYGVHAPVNEAWMQRCMPCITPIWPMDWRGGNRHVSPNVPVGLCLTLTPSLQARRAKRTRLLRNELFSFTMASSSIRFQGRISCRFHAGAWTPQCLLSRRVTLLRSTRNFDWWGLNYYTPMRVADDPARMQNFQRPSQHLS